VVDHLRVLRPAPGVYAFYDGRVAGQRFRAGANWVDDGALSLGIASYAIADGDAALVYDTHVSVEHAGRIRQALERDGVETFTVVLSHWHLDHVAGTAAFADCEIVSCERTAELLTRFRHQIERGTHEGPPAIDPLILPTSTFVDRTEIAVGSLRLELVHTDIHSDDATLVWWPAERLLLCGDTLEDTVTYVDDAASLGTHRANLGVLRQLQPRRILPCHGDPDVIASGGYTAELIEAGERYLDTLLRARTDERLGTLSLRDLVDGELRSPAVHYFEPYEEVHRQNVAAVRAAATVA
jgi:cyclase